MHVICRAWNMFPPWGLHTIITFEWLGETYWHQKNTWFQIRRNSGSISVCHVGSRSSYALGFTYHGAVGAEVRQRGWWQGKLPASEARCLQGGNGRIWNWWSSMIIINLWLSFVENDIWIVTILISFIIWDWDLFIFFGPNMLDIPSFCPKSSAAGRHHKDGGGTLLEEKGWKQQELRGQIRWCHGFVPLNPKGFTQFHSHHPYWQFLLLCLPFPNGKCLWHRGNSTLMSGVD